MESLEQIGFVLLAAGTFVGCAQPESRTVSGAVDPTTFPAGGSSVQLLQNGMPVAEAQPDDAGAFALVFPAGAGYRLQVVAGDTTLPLVIPRLSTDAASSEVFELDVSFGALEKDDLIDLHAAWETIETTLGLDE